MTRQVCNVDGCGARAWSQGMCTFHAYTALKGGATPSVEQHDPATTREEVVARAEALGLKLEVPVRVGARATKKMRSPVA